MHPLRQLFLSLSLRERVLLVAFITTMLLIWAMAVTRGLRTQLATLQLAGQQLRTQEIQLARADEVQLLLASALENLDSSRTYSATQLNGKIDEIARELGVRYDLSSPNTQDSDIFATHVVRLRIDNGNLEELVRLNEVVQQESPYIVLNQFQIAARRNDPRQLDASFEISSIELKDEIRR